MVVRMIATPTFGESPSGRRYLTRAIEVGIRSNSPLSKYRVKRGVLREFGLELNEDIELRVLDSTADIRYLVILRRPAQTDGMREEELAALVTRDSMIGVAQPTAPTPTAA
jgi:hypothetical protein